MCEFFYGWITPFHRCELVWVTVVVPAAVGKKWESAGKAEEEGFFSNGQAPAPARQGRPRRRDYFDLLGMMMMMFGKPFCHNLALYTHTTLYGKIHYCKNNLMLYGCIFYWASSAAPICLPLSLFVQYSTVVVLYLVSSTVQYSSM